jgi:gliding motility-associated lipoprotein GldH
MITNKAQWLLLLGVLWLTACDSKRIFEQNIDFTNESWHRDSVIVFNINITDTLTLHNIYINSRITGQYQYSNMYVFIHSQLPNQNRFTDTLECILAAPDGRWLGKGYGHVWSNQVLYKKNIRFRHPGTYQFAIEQAMRTDELEHVLDAGIRIEKIK